MAAAVLTFFAFSTAALADDQPAPAPTITPPEIAQLKLEVAKALQDIHALQAKVDTQRASGGDSTPLQQQVNEELARLESIEQRLDRVAADVNPPASTPAASAAKTQGDESGGPLHAGYDSGFYIRSAEGNFSTKVNGLVQFRFTGFKPHDGNRGLVPNTGEVNNLDVYLGRLAVSGTAFDPSVHYFFQFQGITAVDNNGISMLDWFVSKTFSKAFTLQGGRSWTPYSYEYYDSPATYLFPDLSTAEYAFSLPRAIGVTASGQSGKFSYAGMVANSIRALDAGGQDNFNSKVAVIGHIGYDILAPYGYDESVPLRSATTKPALSFWGSVAYNPVATASSFENLAPGDTTVNATSTMGFRYRPFSLQTTGYWRRTNPIGGLPSDDSWGWTEQSGLYVLPGRVELAERVSSVNWGAFHFGPAGFANSWFGGPSFPYHRVQEDSLGLNYYFHGHNAKVQAAYSYLHGNTFSASTFGAARVWLQTQFMF